MSYIALSDRDKREMLAKIGISSFDELFRTIPENMKLKTMLNLPSPLTEIELYQYFKKIAAQNSYVDFLSFIGAGAYKHVIPYVVDYLSSRGEFVNPYTPYQPEISQGTLHVIFEFQTLICQLTGMDIANASLYDGASGAAEAVLMAHRLNDKTKVLITGTLHPQYKRAIRTYVKNLGIEIVEIGYDEKGGVDFEDLKEKDQIKINDVEDILMSVTAGNKYFQYINEYKKGTRDGDPRNNFLMSMSGPCCPPPKDGNIYIEYNEKGKSSDVYP